MKYLLLIVAVLVGAHSVAQPTLESTFKPVKLEEFTSLQLFILPDAGTQLIFPFMLDNPEMLPTLKIRLTNANGFSVPHNADDIKASLTGQNTITIIGNVNETSPESIYLGNLFISIGGYNLSISLRTTLNPKDHISNIVFNIDEKERHHLIEQTVKYRTKQLEDDYNRKLADLDNAASDQSLSHVVSVAMTSPDTLRFKEGGKVIIDDAHFDVFADKVLTYGEDYSVLLFEIENPSNKDFEIKGVDIVLNKSDTLVSGSYRCDKPLRRDTTIKCGYATTRPIGDAREITLVIRTNRGQGEFTW